MKLSLRYKRIITDEVFTAYSVPNQEEVISVIGLKPSRESTLQRINKAVGYTPHNLYWTGTKRHKLVSRLKSEYNRIIKLEDNKIQSIEEIYENIGLPPTVNHRLSKICDYVVLDLDNIRWAEETFLTATIDGVTKTVMEWCHILYIPPKRVAHLLSQGEDITSYLSGHYYQYLKEDPEYTNICTRKTLGVNPFRHIFYNHQTEYFQVQYNNHKRIFKDFKAAVEHLQFLMELSK